MDDEDFPEGVGLSGRRARVRALLDEQDTDLGEEAAAMGEVRLRPRISSFASLNGRTWAVSEGFCVLGYFRTEAEGSRRLLELYLERRGRR